MPETHLDRRNFQGLWSNIELVTLGLQTPQTAIKCNSVRLDILALETPPPALTLLSIIPHPQCGQWDLCQKDTPLTCAWDDSAQQSLQKKMCGRQGAYLEGWKSIKIFWYKDHHIHPELLADAEGLLGRIRKLMLDMLGVEILMCQGDLQN